MSKMFEKIKSYYEKGFWNKKQVKDAVTKEKITQEECDQIIGSDEDI